MQEGSQNRRPPDPGIVDELLGRTRRFLTDMIADSLRRTIDDLLRWVLGRTIRYALSASLFIMAAAFLLWGGTEGLIVSGLPPYLAHLAAGAASALAGFLILWRCAPPGRN